MVFCVRDVKEEKVSFFFKVEFFLLVEEKNKTKKKTKLTKSFPFANELSGSLPPKTTSLPETLVSE